MQPRYQIFISSTFKDLEKEREAVLKAVLELQHFPSGMELFTAANATPLEEIGKLIEECDYYVLVIGGKYGSMDEEGISFTEREYDLAIKLKKYVLAFPHAEPENLSVSKSENEPELRKKLECFKSKVRRHLLKPYRTPEDLKSNVLASLAIAFQKHPQTGWVKANGQDNAGLLSKIVTLQETNQALIAENKTLRAQLISSSHEQELAKGNDELDITAEYAGNKRHGFKLRLTWDNLFFVLAEAMDVPKASIHLAEVLEAAILIEIKKSKAFNENGLCKDGLNRESLENFEPKIELILQQLLLLELLCCHPQNSNNKPIRGGYKIEIKASTHKFWSLSEKGRAKFYRKSAFVSVAATNVQEQLSSDS